MDSKITVLPQNQTFTANNGESLLLALAKQGFFVTASCGGKGSCGKCKVRLVSGSARGAQVDENGCILSCKAMVNGDLTIALINENASEKKQSVLDKKGEYGVALDVGTTTLVASLVELKSAKEVAKTSLLNPQGVLGADVLSRIQCYAEGNGQILHDLILNATQKIITDFIGDSGIEIKQLTVAGNTTMLHIFLGEDPTPIGSYPFTPVFTEEKIVDGASLGLNVGTVKLLPSISAYLGSDVTVGVLSCEMLSDDKTRLLVDVGTNGEIVLVDNGKLYGASTAAGPALEGAGIECGMGGVSGAIDSVTLKGNVLTYTTVNGAKAIGICGSGLIDIIAVLVEQKIIDENGTFDDTSASALTNKLQGDKFYVTDEIYLSQKDVRQYQLAKSAIISGIKTLLKEKNGNEKKIERVYLAGGLGQYMNVSSAVNTGLLPKELKHVTVAVGNSALKGAKQCLISQADFVKACEIAKNTETVELSSSLTFQNEFIENMYFIEE